MLSSDERGVFSKSKFIGFTHLTRSANSTFLRECLRYNGTRANPVRFERTSSIFKENLHNPLKGLFGSVKDAYYRIFYNEMLEGHIEKNIIGRFPIVVRLRDAFVEEESYLNRQDCSPKIHRPRNTASVCYLRAVIVTPLRVAAWQPQLESFRTQLHRTPNSRPSLITNLTPST